MGAAATCDEVVRPRRAVRHARRWILFWTACFALFLAGAWILQSMSGIRDAELGHWPDEPAHVVTALMVHDYVRAAFPARPMAFAENYYLHYPKIALGMWPPGFYVAAAFWMFLFGSTETSLLLLMATITALFGATLAGFARPI